MGQIVVEGLGVVEIEGDEPNEQERRAIARAIQQQPEQQPEQQERPEPREVPEPSIRGSIRRSVEDLSFAPQLAVEATPATLGTGIGAAAGAPLGPLGVITGGALGGFLGEFLGQQSGLAPESDVALGLAAGAPVAGPLLGGAFKLGRRAIGTGVQSAAPVRAALSNVAEREAAQEFTSLGTKILQSQKGLLSRESGDLFRVARREGVEIPATKLKNTTSKLSEVDDELAPFGEFPEVEQARKIIDQVQSSLGQGNVSFSTLITTRQLLGSAISRAERAAGIRLGSAKQLFKGMSEDLDELAEAGGRTGRQARVAKAATERAKLEFAVRDLNQGVSRFIRDVPGEEAIRLNVKGLQNFFRQITDPNSKQFDKNFVDALGDEIPKIKRRLSELAKATENAGSPAGRGSIVVRGITAGTGGAIGMAVAGPPGAALGAISGASGPEMLSAVFMNPRAHAALLRAAKAGQGVLPVERWVNIGQILNQAATKGRDQRNVEEPLNTPD